MQSSLDAFLEHLRSERQVSSHTLDCYRRDLQKVLVLCEKHGVASWDALDTRGLRAMGAEVAESADALDITGGPLHAADIDSVGDHRLAMSFAVAAQCAQGVTRIRDCANVATSFPGFLELARAAGMAVDPAPAPSEPE